jgi:hypothetical protein
MNGKEPQCYLKSGASQPYTRPGRYACVPKKDETTHQNEDLAMVMMTTGDGHLDRTHQHQQRVFARNLLPLVAPGQFELPITTVTADVNDDGSITLTASATAVYVWLSTLAQGRFDDNGLILLPGERIVRFVPFGELDVKLLRSSLRVEHLQQHLSAV